VEGVRLAPHLSAACYRICQEALSNAVRHSRAQHVSLELHAANDNLHIGIVDDGLGFDPEIRRAACPMAASLGLAIMEERARNAGGRLEIDSTPGAGTRVKATFPLDS
jgi:signal transduction histidine kinase